LRLRNEPANCLSSPPTRVVSLISPAEDSGRPGDASPSEIDTMNRRIFGYASLAIALAVSAAPARADLFDFLPSFSTPSGTTAPPREKVVYAGHEKPGTVVVSLSERRLYFVQPGGTAMKYGVGVGRPGFAWSGVKTIAMKKEWPDWTPPAAMLKRRPSLPRHMKGGVGNPLGARAMYLGGSDFRIHGSNEPDTIGQAVSSGCIRMTNADVTDLYSRVHVGTRVVVER
jgi:lipoprotein-anchoring transpeptidase ErfK/SrfK